MFKYIILVFSISLNMCFGSDITWSAPKDISSDLVVSGYPRVVISSSGKAIAVYAAREGIAGVIRACFSLDYGINWSSPVTLSNNIEGNAGRAKIDINASDQAVVVWHEYSSITSNKYRIRAINATWNGSNFVWDNLTTISTADSDYPDVAINDSGEVVAIWENDDGGIYAKYSSDAGQTWSDPATGALAAATSGGSETRIAINASGKAIAVWEINNPANAIQVAYSTDAGQSWSDPATGAILSGGSSVNRAEIAMNGDEAIVVWTDNSFDGIDQRVQCGYTLDAGDNWITPAIPLSVAKCQDPKVSLNSAQRAVAMWENNISQKMETAFSTNVGASWSSPEEISESGSILYRKEIDLNVNDYVVATWSIDTGPGGHVVKAASATWNGSSFDWKVPQAISDPANTSLHVYSTMMNNNAIAVWSADDNVRTASTKETSGVLLQGRGAQLTAKLLLQRDFMNELSWNVIPDAVSYRVYTDELLTNMIYSGASTSFCDHGINRDALNSYYITWVASDGFESSSVKIEAP